MSGSVELEPPHSAVRIVVRSLLIATCAGGLLACDGTQGMEGPMVVSDDGGGNGPTPLDAGTSGGIIDPPGFDIPALAQQLANGTLPGWIHAAVHHRGLYVFTWRKAGDFFTFLDFPVVPLTDTVAAKLAQIKRHDQVRLKGSFIANAAPIRHIKVDDLEVVRVYSSDQQVPPRTAVTRIPEDVFGKRELIGKVHAVAQEGRILVIEYGDAVVPVFVKNPALTSDLFRNDKIRLAVQVAPRPVRPAHLWLDMAAPKPLEVMERLVDRHNMPVTEEGDLVRFPISPQISVDVYAVQVVDADGVSREYTLLNDKDPAIFTSIRNKLGAAWASRGGAIDGRNKLINPSIKVRAKGRFNIIDRNQANAQILLDSADDITVTVMP
jgi:hypothetical protein